MNFQAPKGDENTAQDFLDYNRSTPVDVMMAQGVSKRLRDAEDAEHDPDLCRWHDEAGGGNH